MLVDAKMPEKLPATRHGASQQLASGILSSNSDDDLAVLSGIRTAPSGAEARKHFDRMVGAACNCSNAAAALRAYLQQELEPRSAAGISATIAMTLGALPERGSALEWISLEGVKALLSEKESPITK